MSSPSKRQRIDSSDETLGESGKPSFNVTEDFSFDLDHFSIPEHYAPDLGSVMIVSFARKRQH